MKQTNKKLMINAEWDLTDPKDDRRVQQIMSPKKNHVKLIMGIKMSLINELEVKIFFVL